MGVRDNVSLVLSFHFVLGTGSLVFAAVLHILCCLLGACCHSCLCLNSCRSAGTVDLSHHIQLLSIEIKFQVCMARALTCYDTSAAGLDDLMIGVNGIPICKVDVFKIQINTELVMKAVFHL